MTFFDFIYLTFALVSWRFWFPAIQRFCREIWELGDPEYGAQAGFLLDHRSQRYPTAPAKATQRHQMDDEPSAAPAEGFARKAQIQRRDLSSKKRWEGGFGRRGI